ncbi:MAG: DUF1553 domain-containing protein [Phycisphaerales bacterium]|nr:MAG: DUF1553 domain-containing protein [Phycisphaerales bacterium]
MLSAAALATPALAQAQASPPPLNPPPVTQPQPPAQAPSLHACPPRIQLDAQNDVQCVVVVRTGADGITADVSAQAQFTFTPAGIAARTDGNAIGPLADGAAVLTITLDGQSVDVPVTVAQSAMVRPISFRHDVAPALMKAGCNNGACHGNARGQEGFRLSLFGFDPAMDYVNLTRQMSARRVDVADPSASLMFLKATAQVGHGGGQRLEVDDELYRLLESWVAAAAPDDPPGLASLTGISIRPKSCVLPAGGTTQPFIVQATYSDGTDRDVTSLAVFQSLDDTVAATDPAGLVTSGQPGEAFVMARFGTFAEVSQVIVVPDRPFEWPAGLKADNLIDAAVYEKLRKLRILPSEPADDGAFLRRVYLDIIGALPTPDEYRAFTADASPDKRARVIDALLARPEFPQVWAMKWAEMLRIESTKLGVKGVHLYTNWIRDAIFRDVPLDDMVRSLLTAEGGAYHNAPVNFYLVENDPTHVAENVAQVFLGIRIQCARCHNHPFERWTQDDYYSFAAFFAQIGRKPAEDPREMVLFNSGAGDVRHLRTNAAIAPKFLGGASPDVAGRDRRAALAEWLTAADNPYFARCFVNRVWAHFFGRGIVDPPDDVRVTNPPSHPELLEQLARRFVAGGYDVRGLVRDICNSRTYQLSTAANETNASDTRNFSRAMVRRLPAETLMDAICSVTGVPEKFRGLPLGARAVEVADADAGNYFLTTFGRPARQTACTCERRSEPTLSQALHLINGETVWSKIKAGGGRLEQGLAAGKAPGEFVDDLYVAALCRMPTDSERQTALKYVESAGDVRKGMQDVYWAVLNAQEFVFNH